MGLVSRRQFIKSAAALVISHNLGKIFTAKSPVYIGVDLGQKSTTTIAVKNSDGYIAFINDDIYYRVSRLNENWICRVESCE